MIPDPEEQTDDVNDEEGGEKIPLNLQGLKRMRDSGMEITVRLQPEGDESHFYSLEIAAKEPDRKRTNIGQLITTRGEPRLFSLPAAVRFAKQHLPKVKELLVATKAPRRRKEHVGGKD